MKASGGISLGEAFAVALAAANGATLVIGADEDFDDLPLSVEIERVREESV